MFKTSSLNQKSNEDVSLIITKQEIVHMVLKMPQRQACDKTKKAATRNTVQKTSATWEQVIYDSKYMSDCENPGRETTQRGTFQIQEVMWRQEKEKHNAPASNAEEIDGKACNAKEKEGRKKHDRKKLRDSWSNKT